MPGFATAFMAISAALWVGAIVFQTAVVAPTVLKELDASAARRFLRGLFPRFYRFGLYCGVAMIGGQIWLTVVAEQTVEILGLAAATGIMIALQGYSLVLVPQINAARDAGALGRTAFAKLHRLSVVLSVVILILGIGVLATVTGAAVRGL